MILPLLPQLAAVGIGTLPLLASCLVAAITAPSHAQQCEVAASHHIAPCMRQLPRAGLLSIAPSSAPSGAAAHGCSLCCH